MPHRRGAVAAAIVASALTVSTQAGPDWEEGSFGSGDAGRLPESAQIPFGPPLGDLMHISGQLTGMAELGEDDFQDMFGIWISTPMIFSASTESFMGGDATFDVQLWLFDSGGFGLLGVDGVGLGATMGNMSTDGTGIVITTPGLYYLAASLGNSDPTDGADAIFAQLVPGEVSGPDGPGGIKNITDWTAPVDTIGGEYTIAVTGTAFVPAPGAAVVLLLATLRPRRRRR